MSAKLGIVAGSFDPITNGHLWVITEALSLVDKLVVVVGVNPAKKYYFSSQERADLVNQALAQALTPEDFARVSVSMVEKQLLVNFAKGIEATHIIRGLRNAEDFNAEYQMTRVNRKVRKDVHIAFVMTPPELAEISSSTVKGLVGLDDWESLVSQYCCPAVVRAFETKLALRG